MSGAKANEDFDIARPSRISPLAPEEIAQIKSSINITSLNDVILGLLCNSLDAGATRITIDVQYDRGSCTVEDNGMGIAAAEFKEGGGLLKIYCTSKAQSEMTHGGHGTFLASLAAMSLLTVASKHSNDAETNSMTAHQSRIITRSTPASAEGSLQCLSSCTKVVVRNLFGNIPVRVKHRALSSTTSDDVEWKELVQSIVHFLLAWSVPVSVSIRELTSGKTMLLRPGKTRLPLSPRSTQLALERKPTKLDFVLTLFTQACYIAANSWPSWVPISAKTSKVSIKGAISLDPSPTKQHQFISIGFRPLLNIGENNELYQEVNRLFADSAFGVVEDMPDETELLRRSKDRRYKHDGFTRRQLKGASKGIDRWPMFYMCIDLDNMPHSYNKTEQTAEDAARLQVIMKVINAMIVRWLEDHGFRKRNAVTRKAKSSKDTLSNSNDLFRSTTNSKVIEESAMAAESSKSVPSGSPGDPTNNGASGKMLADDGLQPRKTKSAFETWSRIKTGWTTVRRPSSKTDHLNLPPLESIADQSHDVSAVSEVVLDQAVDTQPSNQSEDTWTTWKDPKTNQLYDLNLRSGLLIPASRPSNAPAGGTTSRPDRCKTASSLRLESRSSQKRTSSHSATWLSNVVEKWDNPVFRQSEQAISRISHEYLENGNHEASTCCNHSRWAADSDDVLKDGSAFEHRLSTEALRTATVISQLDNKFILIKVPQNASTEAPTHAEDDEVLVIVDQHAADERCKVEELLKQLCTKTTGIPLRSNLSLESAIATLRLDKPIIFEAPEAEAELLTKHAPFFSKWGILYDVQNTPASKSRITIRTLPPSISERCVAEPRLIIELLRAGAWQRGPRTAVRRPSYPPQAAADECHAWLRQIGDCPKGILDMINSRACRSAIMFNDVLSREECKALLSKLADCGFPFQCAHGRPSMVPLVNLAALPGMHDLRSSGIEQTALPTPSLLTQQLHDHEHPGVDGNGDYVRHFRKWQDRKRA